ncbi:MAG: glycoside-pentoside-hexuronide (GPH):cation symporter [Pseudomonadota bacterium]
MTSSRYIQTQADAAHASKLSIRVRLGFGIGDFGLNGFYTGLNLFLLYYYTDVLGIRPAIAGLLFAAPLVWDAITDPLMGVMAGRTRSRWGRLRPYLLFGCVPLGLSFIGLFAAPLLFPNTVVLASFVGHLIFRTLFTVVSVPYSALTANLSTNSGERGVLTAFRMSFATLGGLAVAVSMLPIADLLAPGDRLHGIFLTSIIYASVGTAAIALSFMSTKERIVSEAPTRFSPGALVEQILKNRPLMILLSAIFTAGMGAAIFAKAIIYYVERVLPVDLSITLPLSILMASIAASVPVWGLISKYVEKRTAWLSGSVIVLFCQLVLLSFPPQTAPIFLFLIGFSGFGHAAYVVTFWSMLPDTVEVGEWHTGVREEAMIYGINQLVLKAGSALGIAVLGFSLDLIGYKAARAIDAATTQALPAISIGVPLLCLLMSITIISFYKIDRDLHARLTRHLSRQRNKVCGAVSIGTPKSS